MSKFLRIATLCAILATLGIQAQAFPGSQQSASPAAQPSGPTTVAAEGVAIEGKVVETMNAGGYTYVCVQSNGQKQWAAMPPTEVKLGEVVAINPGAVMQNFTSSTLKRTFDSIIFSSGLVKK